MSNDSKKIDCCKRGAEVIEWCDKNNFNDLEESGFVIALHGWDVYFENVNYCPFCGKRICGEDK
jgi:hypothetical protein